MINLKKVLFIIEYVLYFVKALFYTIIVIVTYEQLSLADKIGVEEVISILSGLAGRALILVCVAEALHNLLGVGKMMFPIRNAESE